MKWLPFKTWWGVLNFFIVQWLFFRIQRKEEDDGTLIEVSILYPVVPLTGWWSDYRGVIISPDDDIVLWRKK